MKSMQEKITLNIGGVRYETYLGTLQAFPGTKLCRLTEPQACGTFDYDPRATEFFFDRDPGLFDAVLNYYRTKHLHCPGDVCRSVFEEELAFWEIDDAALDPCCWQKLNQAESQEDEFMAWPDNEGDSDQDLLVSVQRRSNTARARWQARILPLFEKPRSSLSAKCLAGLSLVLNIGICLLFIVKEDLEYFSASTHEDQTSSSRRLSYLLHVELFCVLWFMVEFFVRFIFCPQKKKFLRNPLNVADFISLFPVNIELGLAASVEKNNVTFAWLSLLRVAYFFKLLKIVKLVETPLMFRVLCCTFRSILKEVSILMIILALEMMLFGVLAFYAEILMSNSETQMYSIPAAFWWAIITLTTVGYGDICPTTILPKIIAACTALCGILTIIIANAIFFIKFKRYYRAAVIKERRKNEKEAASTLPS